MKKRDSAGVDTVLEAEEVSAVLRDTFYGRTETKRKPRKKKRPQSKPTHYEVICISLYKEDLKQLDAMVTKLKKRGHRKISRSGLIRFALDQVDIDELPRTY